MNDNEQLITVKSQTLAANYARAVAQLLSGQEGRHAEFLDKVQLILSGVEPQADELEAFSEQVRRTGRPVLWFCVTADTPFVPTIGLVMHDDDAVIVETECVLWMSPKDRCATLVPNCFSRGAYSFDSELALKHAAEAPSKTYRRAESSVVRACWRLSDIERREARRQVFGLPGFAKAA
ncbi:hypothetical protein H5J25_04040 [Sphingomonas aliaeris]|uniref:Uncharacterized protein n=1 Tax=Sphingomonas aliaeris TaxID=2759526 RepID=A0A974NVP4_9SPHN|nr:hypothetical protein [Sphingomonas aliaeris]QQV77929.1 hypothetical protein H5J25_04040 [Sphingomonas aliaeris]